MAQKQRKRKSFLTQQQRQQKRFTVTNRFEREGFEEVYDRVRLAVRAIDARGLIVAGSPSKTITLHKVTVTEVWEAILSVLDR